LCALAHKHPVFPRFGEKEFEAAFLGIDVHLSIPLFALALRGRSDQQAENFVQLAPNRASSL